MSFSDLTQSERTIQEQLEAGTHEIQDLKARIAQLSKIMLVQEEQSREVIELYQGVKSFLKVMKLLEGFAVWVAKVGTMAGIFWAIWKYIIVTAIEQGRSPK